MKGMFATWMDGRKIDGCEQLTNLGDLSKWNTANVTDMSYMFSGCKNLSDISGLTDWNTSNVTTMKGMFAGYNYSTYSTHAIVNSCEKLTSLKALSKWNTANVTDMSYMFSGCKGLQSLAGLEKWNTAKLNKMSGMFSWYCNIDFSVHPILDLPKSGFQTLANISALSKWNTSHVSDMSYLFFGCKKLTDIAALANWDTSSVTTMRSMFGGYEKVYSTDPAASIPGCESLKNLNALSNWKTSNVEDMRFMFSGCKTLSDTSPIQSWANKLYEYEEVNRWCAYKMFGRRTPDYTPIRFTNIKWLKPHVLSGLFGDSEGAAYIFNVGNAAYKEINDYFNNIQNQDQYSIKDAIRNNLVITDNDLLLKAMNGRKSDGDKAHLVTVQYGNASEKTHMPAVLDSRINGKDSAPSTDAVEIVKHYIPGAIAEGAGTLRKNNAKVPTDYIAVAEKELTPNAKLSELFQTYTIKAAHTVTFMDGASTVASLKVEAGKKIADLAGETIVTNDAVLTGLTMPNAPAKEGYTFKEWNTKADGTGDTLTKDTPINADTTVYEICTQSPSTPPTPLPMPNPPAKPTPQTPPDDKEHAPDSTNDHENNNTPDDTPDNTPNDTPDNTNAPKTSGDTPSNNTSNDNNDNGNDGSKGANSGSASVGTLGNGNAIRPRTPSATNHGTSGNTASGNNNTTGSTSTGSTNETSASNNSNTSNTDTAQNTTGATNTHNTSPAKNDANRTDNQRSDTWDALRIAMYCLLLLLLLLLIVLIAWIVKRLRERAQQSQQPQK